MLPKTLLQNILRNFESAFDVYVTCSLRSEMGRSQDSVLEF